MDHAGERGAINIYRAQLVIARTFFKDIVETLEAMLAHEREHFRVFDQIMKTRGIRPCYALPIWAVGGWLLGLSTAILGRNAIWICTIRSDEEEHRSLGEARSYAGAIYRPIFWIVRRATELAIWLSTKL